MIIIKNNCYHKVIDSIEINGEMQTQTKELSNFKMDIAKRIINDDYTEDVIRFTSSFDYIKQIEIVIKLSDLASVKKFKERLNKITSGFNFFGTDVDLEKIKELMNKAKFQTIQGTKIIGINEIDGEKYFVSKDKCINKNFKESDKFMLNTSNTINLENSFDDLFLTSEDAKKISEKLFNFNIETVTYTVISSICALFINPILTKHNIKFPNIALLGESGSAKSETKDNIIKSILGDFIDEIAADIKPFGSIKYLSETNTFPLSIEEHKTWTMSKPKQDLVRSLLRSAYDRHTTTKGHADQTITQYKILTPILLTGESSVEEKAFHERTMIVHFAKRYHTKEFKSNFIYLKKNKNLLKKLGNTLLHKTLNINEQKLIETYNKYLNSLEILDFPDRIKNNICVCTLGYQMVYEIFKELGIKLKSPINVLDILCTGQYDFNLTGSSENKGIIENTFEIWAQMINADFLPKENKHYFQINDNECYLSIPNIFNEFTRYLKQYNIEGEYEKRKSHFKQLLTKSIYYLGEKRINNSRYVIIDMNKVHEKKIDFDIEDNDDNDDDFPNKEKVTPNIPIVEMISLTSGDINGRDIITTKYNLNTNKISDVKNKIFINDNKQVYIPAFEKKEIIQQCYDNLIVNTEKLFEIGDNYFEKVFRN